jgi:hypothetical protein
MSDTDIPRLPQSPDLEQERTRAKELLKALRIGEARAILRLRSNHPRFAHLAPDAAATGVKLSDAQWVRQSSCDRQSGEVLAWLRHSGSRRVTTAAISECAARAKSGGSSGYAQRVASTRGELGRHG